MYIWERRFYYYDGPGGRGTTKWRWMDDESCVFTSREAAEAEIRAWYNQVYILTNNECSRPEYRVMEIH